MVSMLCLTDVTTSKTLAFFKDKPSAQGDSDGLFAARCNFQINSGLLFIAPNNAFSDGSPWDTSSTTVQRRTPSTTGWPSMQAGMGRGTAGKNEQISPFSGKRLCRPC